MFNKNARWYFPIQDPNQVVQALGQACQSRSIMLVPSGPSRWEGKGSPWGTGMSPKVTVMARPDQQGMWVEVHTTVDFDGTGILLIYLGLLCLPIAIVYLILSHQKFEQNARDMMNALQQSVAHLAGNPQAAAFGQPQGWG
ncbi:MAG TPA: hypothetical protein ENK57_11755 [Polyangiaceae bacterium]|nr:hypothetical protein [Polyangiaceae bacterium]